MALTPPVLLCTDVFWARHHTQVEAIAPALEVVQLLGTERISQADLERVSIAVISADSWPARMRHLLKASLSSPNLDWLHTFFAGVDDPVFTTFADRGVRITSSSGSSARPIAHVVTWMLLSLGRGTHHWAAAQREHRWAPQAQQADLDGRHLAVIGMGPIGYETARLGQALGMSVRGCRRTIAGDEPCPTTTFAHLDELLEWADFVVLALPLTPSTSGLINAARLVRMRAGSMLINVGRGGLIDEPALVDSLRSGHLAGAGLDVFATEPLPADSPLWDMPNVIVTPHNSGDTDGTEARSNEIFLANLPRYLGGEPLHNEVART